MPSRTHLVAVVVTAIAVSAMAGCGSDGRQPASAAPGMHGIGATAAPAVAETAVPAAAIEAARKVAAPNTNGTPFELVRAEALTPAQARTGATVSRSEDIAVSFGGGPAYLITFRGEFIGYAVTSPAGAQLPRGRYFSVGIDGADMSVSGLSITATEPPPYGQG